MSKTVSIVMYHYVRDLEKTRFPRIKARRASEFRSQVRFIAREYNLVTMQEVVNALRNHDDLPDKAALLTFDDGYIEHYTTVFPVLHEMGIQGSFFPPVASAERGELLDVNRIHFLLAVTDSGTLSREIESILSEEYESYSIEAIQKYRVEFAKAARFDDAETIYVKRMLQHVLPETIRHEIARRLFAKFVSKDEPTFASELYVNMEQLRVMSRSGMYVGSHGDSHYWLNTLDSSKLDREIENSLRFLKGLDCPVNEFWAMCYPFGAYSENVLNVLRAHGCTLGLTTNIKIADLERDDPLLLPRLDTNDLPI